MTNNRNVHTFESHLITLDVGLLVFGWFPKTGTRLNKWGLPRDRKRDCSTRKLRRPDLFWSESSSIHLSSRCILFKTVGYNMKRAESFLRDLSHSVLGINQKPMNFPHPPPNHRRRFRRCRHHWVWSQSNRFFRTFLLSNRIALSSPFSYFGFISLPSFSLLFSFFHFLLLSLAIQFQEQHV